MPAPGLEKVQKRDVSPQVCKRPKGTKWCLVHPVKRLKVSLSRDVYFYAQRSTLRNPAHVLPPQLLLDDVQHAALVVKGELEEADDVPADPRHVSADRGALLRSSSLALGAQGACVLRARCRMRW